MVCEKYSKLITDDALGGLSPERGADLQEHLAQCFSCRYEFDHAKGIAAASGQRRRNVGGGRTVTAICGSLARANRK